MSDDGSVFHCTSEETLKEIEKSGKIKRSVKTNDDVTYGEGTYLTSKHPKQHTPMEIAKSNYDGSPQHAESMLPRTQVAIAFDPKEINAKEVDQNRKIYKVEGDIDMSKAKAIYRLQNDGSYKKDEGN